MPRDERIWSTPGAPLPAVRARYVPPAPEPGPKANGLTQDWAAAIAEAQWMPESLVLPEPAGPRHARQRHALLRAAACAVAAAMIALGVLVVAAGTMVRGIALGD